MLVIVWKPEYGIKIILQFYILPYYAIIFVFYWKYNLCSFVPSPQFPGISSVQATWNSMAVALFWSKGVQGPKFQIPQSPFWLLFV